MSSNKIYTIVYYYYTFILNDHLISQRRVGQIQVEANSWLAAKLKAMKQANISHKQILRCL